MTKVAKVLRLVGKIMGIVVATVGVTRDDVSVVLFGAFIFIATLDVLVVSGVD